jgi:two-component system sensor histidine kinase/response regulator
MNFTRYLLAVLFVLLGFSLGLAAPFELTDSEREWLDSHQGIRVGIVNNGPPLGMVDEDGIPRGVDPDVVALLNGRRKGKLKIVTGLWNMMFEDAKAKRLDVLMNFTPSQKRRTLFDFTRPYMLSPHVIVAKKEGQHFGNLGSLAGQTIALVKNTFLVSYIKVHYKNIRIREYESPAKAVDAVKRGEAQAYMGNKLVASYLLSANNIRSLEIHGQSNETSDTNVIAVRKDWPELTSILDRALASIPHNTLKGIMDKWEKAVKEKDAAIKLKLTREQLDWINDHPTIVVGSETDWPPYDYVSNGKAAGFGNDYLRLLAQKADLNLRFVHGFSWKELLNKAKKNEIDILPCLWKNDDREKFLRFTPGGIFGD